MNKITPLKIFVIYWAFTLLLFAFGPFAWKVYKPLLFWGLNIFYVFAFAVGWFFSSRIGFSKRRAKWTEEDDKVFIRRLGPLLYINLFYETINIFRAFSFAHFDISALIQRIISGISDMGSSYNSFQDSVNSSSAGIVGGAIVTVFNYVWDIWGFSTLVLGVIYFKKLKAHQKCLAAACVFLEIVFYLARGTNIGVFRIVLIFLVLSYIKYIKTAKKTKGKKTKLIVLGVVAFVVVVQLFDTIMKSRGGIAFWETGAYNIGGIYINRDSVFFKILPSGFHQLLVSLSGYLSQGYYGMSLTMQIPWKPMWGIGYSMALQNTLSNFIPTIADASYQVRVEQFGWDSYTQWHSMYSWFANDLSYFGVPIIMLIFGYIFHKSLKDTIELNNPYAKVMLYFMFLMAVFLPCNNQLGQSTYSLFSFFYVLVMWQFTKRKIKISI